MKKPIIILLVVMIALVGLIPFINPVFYDQWDSSTYEDNLVLWFHLDNNSVYGENDTHVYDFSGNGNNGSVEGADFTPNGKIGGGYSFDGTNAINLGDVNETEDIDELTLAAWVKFSSTGSLAIISKGRYYDSGASYSIELSGTNRWNFAVSNSRYRWVSLTPVIGQWYFVTGTYSNITNEMKLYIDGNLMGGGTDSGTFITVPNTVEDLMIGNNSDGEEFNGLIDEVMIFNRTLTAQEVEELYAQQNEECVVPYGWLNITESVKICEGNYAVDGSITLVGSNLAEMNISNTEINFTNGAFANTNTHYTRTTINDSIIRGDGTTVMNYIRYGNFTSFNTQYLGIKQMTMGNAGITKQYVYVDNITVDNNGANANLWFSYATDNVIIKNSIFRNNTVGSNAGLYFKGVDNLVIENTTIYDTGGTGIASWRTANTQPANLNTRFSNNTIYDTGAYGIAVQDSNLTIIENNNIQNVVGYIIDTYGFSNHAMTRNNTAINGTNGIVYSMGDGGAGNSTNLTMQDNKVYNVTAYGIYFNTVWEGYSTNDYVNSAGQRCIGISNNVENMTVLNFTGENCYTYGVVVQIGSTNILFDNLTLTNATTSFYFKGDVENITVRNSLVGSTETHNGEFRGNQVNKTNFTNVLGWNFFIDEAKGLDFNLSASWMYFNSWNNENKINLTDLPTGTSIYDVTNDKYLFTSSAVQGDEYNFTLAVGQEVNISDFGCIVPYDSIKLTSDTTLCQGTYYLNDTDGNGIIIDIDTNDGITLDCNGATLIGNWTEGIGSPYYKAIDTFTKSNIVIENCNIYDYYIGVRVQSSENITIRNSNFSHQRINIYLNNVENITIHKNWLNDTSESCNIFTESDRYTNAINISTNEIYYPKYYGVCLRDATNSVVEFNTFNQGGIELTRGNYTSINNNKITQQTGDNYFILGQNVSYSNFSYNNATHTTIRYQDIYLTGDFSENHHNEIHSNYFYNQSNYASISINEGNNTLIYDNIFNIGDKAIDVVGSNIIIRNNTITNMTTSEDGYSLGILVRGKDTINRLENITIRDNVLIDMGSRGISVLKASNLDIINNTFDIWDSYLKKNLEGSVGNNGGIDDEEISCAIMVTELLAGWTSDNSELAIDNRTNKLGNYNSTDILIANNTFSNSVQCFYHGQGATNVTHDLEDYWYRKFTLMYKYVDVSEFYLNNNFSIMSFKSGSNTIDNFTLYGYRNSEENNITISKNHLYFKNLNQSEDELELFYNLTNALVYNTNGTIYGSKLISANDGNVNMTLAPNNASYVLDEFNLTENETRANTPLWFSYSSGSIRNISSNLTDTIDSLVVVNTSWITPETPRYTSHTGTYTKTYTSSEYTYNSATSILSLNITGIEQASGSNQLEIDYGIPSITITNPLELESITSETIYFTFNTSEATYCTYSLDNGTNTSVTSGDNITYEFTIGYPTMTNGDHNLRIFCNDTYGNQNVSGAIVNFNRYHSGTIGGDTGSPGGTSGFIQDVIDTIFGDEDTNETSTNETIIDKIKAIKDPDSGKFTLTEDIYIYGFILLGAIILLIIFFVAIVGGKKKEK